MTLNAPGVESGNIIDFRVAHRRMQTSCLCVDRAAVDGPRALGDAYPVKLERHVEIADADVKAADILCRSTSLPKATIKRAMTKGAVWLSRGRDTRRIRRADRALKPGDTLHLYYDQDILAQTPADATLIADEDEYSIWYKPFGMLSQGSKWGDHCTINRWVENHLKPQRPAFLVHRLDRAATGLIIIAHGRKTAAYFARQFRLGGIEKRYRAIVHGHFPDAMTIETPIENKPALSHVRLLDFNLSCDESLLEVTIDTGRKHQIRRHLSEAGHPIIGDRIYGATEQHDDRNLCLTSCHVSFLAPPDGIRRSYSLPTRLLPSLASHGG